MKVKHEFEVKGEQLAVRRPTAHEINESNKVRIREFHHALKAEAMVRAKLDSYLEEQGLWDATKERQFKTLQTEIREGEKQLRKGKIPLKRAKEIALDIKIKRRELVELLSIRREMENNTAEGVAENAAFNYLVYCCLVYNNTEKNGQRYYGSFDEYMEKADDEVAMTAASHLLFLTNNLNVDQEKKLPENKFLLDYGLVDDKLRLIDKRGRLVDREGKLIDEEGYYLSEDGKRISETEEEEAEPFLDDDGNPIILVSVVQDEPVEVLTDTPQDVVEESVVAEAT
jgi:predicted metal-binding transcription factor (methanogenesis marker protein 9)